MAGAQPITSYRMLFKQLEIVPVWHQYILSLINFIINNQEIFQTSICTHHLHRPNANLLCFLKSTFYAGIKVFKSLPPSVTILKNDKAQFKATLRNYLYTHSLNSADEFFYV